MDVSRSAYIQKGELEKDGIDVTKGHDIQAHILFVEIKVYGSVQVIGNVRFMGADDAFGLAGCAGRVDQNPGVPGDNFCIGLRIR